MNTGQPIEILLVEDDPGDVELTLEVMKSSKLKLNINVVEDGIEAVNYLEKSLKNRDVPLPDLILLDLNLPRMDGRETLDRIKADSTLRKIPVVILTTSKASEDIVRTYTAGANCYITKPVGLKEFTKVVSAIEEFWFTIVKLPKDN